MDHQNGQLDSSIRIVTPENTSFEYRMAGPFRRLPAYLIDLAIRIGACAVAAVAVGVFSVFVPIPGLAGLWTGALFIFWFFLAWFYGGLFETYWNGQTPGKRLTGIRVLAIDGQPVHGLQAVMRNLLREADALPFMFALGSEGVAGYILMSFGLYQVGFFATLMNRRFQRLGDLVSGTMVVVEEPQWFSGVVRMGDPAILQLADQIPPSFRPSRSLVRALASYVQRRYYLHWGRRLEIARHVALPLRDLFQLPPETNLDLLLCALYHRTFVADGNGGDIRSEFVRAVMATIPATSGPQSPPAAASPFSQPPPQPDSTVSPVSTPAP